MRAVLLAGVVAFALGGCITKAVQEKELAESGPKDDAYCKSIGAQPNTPAYTQCRLTLRQQLLNTQADTRASLNAAAEGLAQAGRDISNNQARIDAANASRNINCTSTRFGSQINTSCY